MARTFTAGSSEYLLHSGDVGATIPFAVSCRIRPHDVTGAYNVFGLGDTNGFDGYSLYLAGDAGDFAVANTIDVGAAKSAVTSNTYTADTWQHLLGIWVATNRRDIYLNADVANMGTETTATTITGIDNATLGGLYINSAIQNPYDGDAGELAIWNLAGWPGATAADKAASFVAAALQGLNDGFCPLFWKRGLIGYWPEGGCRDTNEHDYDIVGAFHFTDYATPTTADHPVVIYPGRPKVRRYAIAPVEVVEVEATLSVTTLAVAQPAATALPQVSAASSEVVAVLSQPTTTALPQVSAALSEVVLAVAQPTTAGTGRAIGEASLTTVVAAVTQPATFAGFSQTASLDAVVCTVAQPATTADMQSICPTSPATVVCTVEQPTVNAYADAVCFAYPDPVTCVLSTPSVTAVGSIGGSWIVFEQSLMLSG